MRAKLLVDSDQFWSSLQEDIRSSRDSIYIQTLSFEGDSVGHMLSDELTSSSSRDKRILVDSYTRYVLSDHFLYTIRNIFDPDLQAEKARTLKMVHELNHRGVLVKFINPAGLVLNKLPARNHKKMILIDDHISYIGGINFSEHNFDWHDLMIRFEDPRINKFLKSDFLSTWQGRYTYSEKAFDKVRFYLLDGSSNESKFAVVLKLIDDAQESILIQSPYISFPFYERLRSASQRNVKITLIAPAKNNRRIVGYYTLWEARRSGIELRLYAPGMTHAKYMMIDDRILIFGSTNFDYVSYKIEQELIVVITDAEFIDNFRKQVIDVDLQRSVAFNGKLNKQKGFLCYAGLKMAGMISISIAKL